MVKSLFSEVHFTSALKSVLWISGLGISLSFRVFVKHVFIIFILILPCSIVDNLGVWSIPVTILISYLLIAIEGIARNLEEPFGLTEDHLNLNAITEGIEKSVNEILLKNGQQTLRT